MTGCASKGRFPHRRFSVSRLSSSGDAIARRGPTRIHARPLQRTGGFSDGCTMTTATEHRATCARRTSMVGNGVRFPSSRMCPRVFNNSSVMASRAQLPSSSIPTKTTPGSRRSGRSLANAQTASRILSKSEALLFRSARSLSPVRSRASRSSSVRAGMTVSIGALAGKEPPASIQPDLPRLRRSNQCIGTEGVALETSLCSFLPRSTCRLGFPPRRSRQWHPVKGSRPRYYY